MKQTMMTMNNKLKWFLIANCWSLYIGWKIGMLMTGHTQWYLLLISFPFFGHSIYKFLTNEK